MFIKISYQTRIKNENIDFYCLHLIWLLLWPPRGAGSSIQHSQAALRENLDFTSVCPVEGKVKPTGDMAEPELPRALLIHKPSRKPM